MKIGEIVHYGETGPYGQPCIPAVVVGTAGFHSAGLMLVPLWQRPGTPEYPGMGNARPSNPGNGAGLYHSIGDCAL